MSLGLEHRQLLNAVSEAGVQCPVYVTETYGILGYDEGAGRNVATAERVEALLDACVCDEETCAGWGINAAAAKRAKELLDASLKKSGRRA